MSASHPKKPRGSRPAVPRAPSRPANTPGRCTKMCPICGSRFVPVNGRKYCCADCSREAARRNSKVGSARRWTDDPILERHRIGMFYLVHAMKTGSHNSARRCVCEFVATGGLFKPPCCHGCGKHIPVEQRKQLQAHHRDYYQPLWVIWLCPACHKAVHRGEHPWVPESATS